MSPPPNGPNLGRQYLILFLVLAGLVVVLGYVFRQAGMFATGSPQQDSATTPPPPEASWEDQIAAVQRGESDRIEITQTLVRDQHLTQLAELASLRELLLDKTRVGFVGV